MPNVSNKTNKPPSDKKLTDRQERFCREYIIDYNATQAAVRSGYSEKSAAATASENLKKANVLARVRELQAEQRERLCITADWVIMSLVDVYEKCMQLQPVMVWDPEQKKKVESGEYVFDSKGALNALEMIGKHLAVFEPKNASQESKKNISELISALKG